MHMLREIKFENVQGGFLKPLFLCPQADKTRVLIDALQEACVYYTYDPKHYIKKKPHETQWQQHEGGWLVGKSGIEFIGQPPTAVKVIGTDKNNSMHVCVMQFKSDGEE